MKGIVLGYYGAGNVGDELMLSCLNQWLAPADYELTAVSEHPEMTQQQHGMPAIANAPLLGQWGIGAWKDGTAMALIRAIRSTDALIIGGGDILKDHLGWRSYSYTADKIGLALLCGKDVMLLNVGIRAPVTGFGRRFLRWMLPRCRLVIVRDEESRSVCEQFGAQSPPCVPDIVAYLPRLSPPAPPVAASKDSSEYLLVCLRSTSNVHGRYELNDKRLDSLAAALDAVASKRNWQVRFTPFQSLVGHDDSHVHRLIAERMTERDRVVIDAQTPPTRRRDGDR